MSQSIMPQLDKFTYFTQFFWSCLFLFTFYIPRSYILNLKYKMIFLYITNPLFPRILFYLKLLFLFFFLVRTGLVLWNNLYLLLLTHTVLGILPADLDLLGFYLNQPNQDPEWVQYVRERVITGRGSLSPRAYEAMVRDFLNTEMCCATRNQVSSLYIHIFYGIEDSRFWIDPQDLEKILKVHLERVEFDHSALGEILRSLCVERENSAFYEDVKTAQAEHFQGFLKQKHQARVEMQQRLDSHRELEFLSKRITSLAEKNGALREKIQILAKSVR
nr:hypothetical protein [Solanum melongena]WMB96733.1 hypothetical protein [Solanum melongena]